MSRRLVYLLALGMLLLVGAAIGGLVYLRSVKERSALEEAFCQEVAALRPGSGVRVKAQVKDLPGFDLPGTPWVDITEYADLLFKLIQPPVKTPDRVTHEDLLCEVRIQRDSEELVLHIIWGGKGNLWFSQPGLRSGFTREQACYPLEPGIDGQVAIYTDEGLAFTYLVLALSQKDKAGRARREAHLRTSLGVPGNSPRR